MPPADRRLLATLTVVTLALAGCVAPSQDVEPTAAPPDTGVDVSGPVSFVVEQTMAFAESVVSPAVGIAADLYEPTMEVSDTGTIYVAGHVIGAITTGTPAYFSNDDGATWEQLPFLGPLQAPSPVQGAQPPPGDEGFIVAGDNGQAWMADIYLFGFSITGWCDNGATQCYDNRQAYDRVASTTDCNPVSLNDRPWAAYGNGKLLLVNNPGGGPLQIGVMDVPPAVPLVGAAQVNGPVWNTCASEGGGIPGIPAMRDDGLFAVPQVMGGGGGDPRLTVIVGNADDIFTVETRDVGRFTSTGGGTINNGRTAFDQEGTLFVGVRNNTQEDEGRFILAASTDDGQTFKNVTFDTGTVVRSLYLDGNMHGPGALLTWSQLGEQDGRSDWYVAHVHVGPEGEPVLSNVNLAVDEGPPSSAHVMGAAAGPDGRAYFVNFVGNSDRLEYLGSTPISVLVQQDGPALPMAVPMEADEDAAREA